MIKYRISLLLIAFCGLTISATATPATNQSGYIIHLLTYLASDYAGAVQNGKIVNQEEYQEMLEFSESIDNNVGKLNIDESLKAELKSQSALIKQKVASHENQSEIAPICEAMKKTIIAKLNVEIAPLKYPSVSNGKIVYMSHCAKCHGDKGYGDGLEGKGLDPAPRNFHDNERMATLSAFNLYNTIKYGIEGTGMEAHPELEEKQVWDAAFYILTLNIPNLKSPTNIALSLRDAATLTNTEIDAKLGQNAHQSIRWYEPTNDEPTINKAFSYLEEAKAALLASDFGGAEKLVTMAYLEGVEPFEKQLDKEDPSLKLAIERNISDIRTQLKSKHSAEAMTLLKKLDAQLNEAIGTHRKADLKPFMSFVMTASIILREGLEALLIIVIFMNVLGAANVQRGKKLVHLGWISALVVGIGTWFMFAKILTSNRLNLEVVEGTITIFAVVLMVYIGLWLHRKSSMDQWKAYINDKIKSGKKFNTLWGIFSLSFLVVFREIFESILFISSINLQSKGQHLNYILAGCILAFAVVVILYIAITHFAKKIPFTQLINYSIIMLCLLSVVLVGKGIHSFQEANLISQTFFDLPGVDLLGFFPTYQTTLAQIITAIGLFFMFRKMQSS